MDFEAYKKQLEKMKENFDFMSDMNNKIVELIQDPAQQSKYAEISADTQNAIELMKKGDVSGLNKLQKKYADQDSK